LALFGEPAEAVEQTHFEVSSADQGQAGVLLAEKALAAGLPFAIAFVDVRMPPGWDGVETTRKLWELDANIQVVLCTAYSDYSWGELFDQLGHSDGLLILKKPFDAVEALQLAYALTEKWWLHQQSQQKMEELESRVLERTAELAKTNAALQRQQTELRVLFDFIPAMICFKDTANGVLRANQRFAALFGKSIEAIEGKPFVGIDPQEASRVYADDLEVIQTGVAQLGKIESVRIARGETLWIQKDKVPVCDRDGKVVGIVVMGQDITERKRADEELQWKTAFLEAQVHSSIDGIIVVDQQGKKILQNQRTADLFQIPRHIVDDTDDEKQVRWVTGMVRDPDRFLERVLHLYSHPDEIGHDEIELKDGTILDRYSAPVLGKEGRSYGRIWTFRDITERRLIEDRLVQSQRLETVGKLAGGIAHEFNSILTAIIGQSELLLGDLPDGSPLAKNVIEISQAALRAATLTRQLLAYGRKQILQPEALDLNLIIASKVEMIHHLTGVQIETQIVPAPGLQTVKADAGQMEEVIVNMVINARDAMPGGGKLVMETANVSFDQDSVGRYPELKPGDYVVLAITDTGAGMSDAVKARVFEPFFTTKGVGQGAGLGLSTCYGIVKQSGGHISVYSELGRGTTFKIYLPQAEPLVKISTQRLASSDLLRGTETILLVEDDPALREMATTLLSRLGYTVLAAANGVEALILKQKNGSGHIDLLFTDVVMPHMSGKELADRMQAAYPHTRILFTSAYAENAIVHQGVLDPGVTLLQKPFTPSALARKVRETLDRPIASEP